MFRGKSIYEQVAKKLLLAKSYGMGADAMLAAYGGNDSKRFDDMKCIGGSITLMGHRYTQKRKLFVAKGKPNSLLYVKSARERFAPLCVDGTLSNNRTWAELVLPREYKRTDGGTRDGGHVTVMNLVDAAKLRVQGNDIKVFVSGPWSNQR